MSLQRFDRDGLELVINSNTGECFASQSAIARMVNVSRQAISQWIGVNGIPVIEGEILTPGGLQGVNLLDENAIYQAFAKYKPELLIQCAKAGIRVYLHQLAGYQFSINDTRQDLEEQFADTPTLKQIDYAAEMLGKRFGLPYEQSYLIQKIRRFYPALAGDPVPPQHRASLPESRLLTPTEIASELGFKYKSGNPNPRQVNALLEKLGYQVKVADKWDLTELGKRYGVFKPIDTNSRSDKDQLMWQSTLIDVLKEFSVRY